MRIKRKIEENKLRSLKREIKILTSLRNKKKLYCDDIFGDSLTEEMSESSGRSEYDSFGYDRIRKGLFGENSSGSNARSEETPMYIEGGENTKGSRSEERLHEEKSGSKTSEKGENSRHRKRSIGIKSKNVKGLFAEKLNASRGLIAGTSAARKKSTTGRLTSGKSSIVRSSNRLTGGKSTVRRLTARRSNTREKSKANEKLSASPKRNLRSNKKKENEEDAAKNVGGEDVNENCKGKDKKEHKKKGKFDKKMLTDSFKNKDERNNGDNNEKSNKDQTEGITDGSVKAKDKNKKKDFVKVTDRSVLDFIKSYGDIIDFEAESGPAVADEELTSDVEENDEEEIANGDETGNVNEGGKEKESINEESNEKSPKEPNEPNNGNSMADASNQIESNNNEFLFENGMDESPVEELEKNSGNKNSTGKEAANEAILKEGDLNVESAKKSKEKGRRSTNDAQRISKVSGVLSASERRTSARRKTEANSKSISFIYHLITSNSRDTTKKARKSGVVSRRSTGEKLSISNNSKRSVGNKSPDINPKKRSLDNKENNPDEIETSGGRVKKIKLFSPSNWNDIPPCFL